MVELLKRIGLSELEARCYMTLLEAPGSSGYEIAKRVSVSRTNVYAALRSLTDKGACRCMEGDPILYDAVPIDQLVRLLQTEFEQTTKALIQEFKSPPRTSPSFYNVHGSKAMDLTIRRLIANADRSVIVDIWSEDLHWVEESLLEAEERGITVILITLGSCQTPLRNVVLHKRSEEWPDAEERKFSILCDFRSALLGSFGSQVQLSALETNHPAVIQVLKNEFYHDLIMTEIERDFGTQLTAKYGKEYENIANHYLNEKGWIL